MIMRNKFRSAIVAALSATVTLASLNLTPAQAASNIAASKNAVSNTTSTEFSARRYHRGNSRAAMAMFGLVAGSIMVAAAADQYNDGYYGGGPYYGGGYRYRGYGGWHHWHHWR
jgi:hypothetical protein